MDRDTLTDRTIPGPANGQAQALRLLRVASRRRVLALHALIVVVLLATAQAYDGSFHRLSHWLVLTAYAACSLGLGLAEWRQRRAAGDAAQDATLLPDRGLAETLGWASVVLNAAVAVYVEIEHMTTGAAAGFDDAAGAVSRLPAFLLLLQTGLTMRVGHTALFAGLVALAWAGAILCAALGPEGAVLGPQVALSEEVPGLVTFVVASLVVIDGIRRLRGTLAAALRLEHERSLLARFVPGSVAVRLAQQGGFGAVRERHACLFVLDIRGFSALTSERDRAEVVGALLDTRSLAHVALSEHGGIVDKYVGDSVLAHFLVGSGRVQARAALDASLTILARLEALNRGRVAKALPPIRVTIALHAGDVLAGVFDDGLRAEFTALGPPMNMLARLEARAKARDLTLAASEDFVRLLVAGPVRPRPVADDDGTPGAPALFAMEEEAAAFA